MERETRNSSLGFSWADEVEREEQEEEQKAGREAYMQEKPGGKPNPFGDARPREVVLAEKGVDWRKLDKELDHHSILRKDKKLMENISVRTASISRQEHFSLGLRCPDRNKPEMQIARSVSLEQQEQNSIPLAPPLKYPPKNFVALMKQIRRGHTDRSDLYICSENPHQHRYPFNSGSSAKFHAHELMHHWPMDAAHGVTMLDHNNFSMERAGHERVYPDIHSVHARQDMESNCKRKWYRERLIGGTTEEMQTNGRGQFFVDMNMEQPSFRKNGDDGAEYHWENNEEGSGRGNYVHERRFIGRTELQANGRRRILGDHNMERSNIGKNCRDGEEYYWESIEDGSGRNYEQELMSPPVELHEWRHSLRSASEVTEYRGMLVGHSAGSVINRGRGAGTGDNCKNSRMLSSSKPRPSHRRRKGKQARK